MNFTSTQIPYSKTNKFSEIVIDYISNIPLLKPFYSHFPNLEGIEKAIEERNKFPTDRSLLVNHLKNQYNNLEINSKVSSNIDSLESNNTFTICTAHQPNIFTGHLYFIYKIVHAIKLLYRIPAYVIFSDDRIATSKMMIKAIKDFAVHRKEYKTIKY